MKERFSLVMTLAVIILTFSVVFLPMDHAFANIADGNYQVNYEVKEKSSNNTSIADGYFSRPATLTVKDGVKHIELTVTSADMIKQIVAPSGPVTVISEGNNTRTIKFRVDDLAQPIPLDMDIVVPDLYERTHTARAIFDISGLPAPSVNDKAGAGDAGKGSTNEQDISTPAANPPTGDDTPIALYVALLLGSVAILTIYKFRVAKNN